MDNFEVEILEIGDLKAHPKNYRAHPEDQLEHLVESLRENGFYRNIVVARDNTILAGHGVVKAATKLGLTHVPVIRLDVDANDPQAIRVLIGDNEIEHLAIQDDRALTNMLKEIREFDVNALLGTGFDDRMLANLVFVTRPKSEIKDFDAASHWVGMPEYEEAYEPTKITLSFKSEEDRERCAELLGVRLTGSKHVSSWWPVRERRDLTSVRFEVDDQ